MAYEFWAYVANRQTRSRGALLAALMIGTSIGGGVVGAIQNAAAQSAVQTQFSIPAGSLSRALTVFGRQAGLQVTFLAATASNRSTSGFSGSATPDQALARILQGTGLSYQFTNGTTVAISSPTTSAGRINADGSTVLDVIEVTARNNAASGAGFQGTPDWVYETPASVSVISREAIQNAPSRNARDLFDNVAGVLANRSEGQNPGISVNIRGLQDQGRVVTMIDGARQNFQRAGHGATQFTYVDTAFIREVDIEKSGTSGVGGAGALGGSVNFRTLGAADLIAPGRNFGIEVNATTGTNEFKFDGSAIAAARISDSFALIGGVSRKRIGEYAIGKNGELDVTDGTYRNNGLLFSGYESWSTLLKAEADITDDLKAQVSWLRNDVKSSQGLWFEDQLGPFKREDEQGIVNNTLSASFHWQPDSPLINLKGRAWYNRLNNNERRGSRSRVTLGAFTPITYSLGTFGGSLENTSRFTLPMGEIALNYGAEAFRDNGKTSTIDLVDPITGVDWSYGYKGMNPSGRRDVASGFANATFTHGDWLTASGGLRYDYYRITGSTVIQGPTVSVPQPPSQVWREGECFPLPDWAQTPEMIALLLASQPGSTLSPDGTQICEPGQYVSVSNPPTYDTPLSNVDVDLSQAALLPTFMIAVRPFTGIEPFVRYSQSMRPPTIMESLFSGGHPPPALPAQNAPNPWLKPERAETWEIGVNIVGNAVFTAEDRFRAKVVWFDRIVENYISLGHVRRSELNRDYISFVNLDGPTKMRGIEVEGNYDVGVFYVGGSFSYLSTDWATSYTYNGASHHAEPSVLFVPPKTKFTIDSGVRLFDQKLLIGGRMTQVGAGKPPYGLLAGGYVTEDYTVYDLYGAYAFTENVKLRFALNNVTDLAYVPALGYAELPAPGRTVTASLNFRF